MTATDSCGHWLCRIHRVLSVLDTGGVIFLTNRWPIPCRKTLRAEITARTKQLEPISAPSQESPGYGEGQD